MFCCGIRICCTLSRDFHIITVTLSSLGGLKKQQHKEVKESPKMLSPAGTPDVDGASGSRLPNPQHSSGQMPPPKVPVVRVAVV